MVERMFKVAFWCVQEQPEARPPIGVVVKMLEGEMDIAPPANPFQHLMMSPIVMNPWTLTASSDRSKPEPSDEKRTAHGPSSSRLRRELFYPLCENNTLIRLDCNKRLVSRS
ncbi:hypothetical protein EJB05_14563, partial [Eragrostis curvula]